MTKQSELTNDQSRWLIASVHRSHKWQYENGVVNVQGDVHCAVHYKNLFYSHFPVQFGKVTGDFKCHGLNLESLKGCPTEIGGYFDCHNNKLTNLDYAPLYVGGEFDCESNPFILNDKLFENIKQMGGWGCIKDYSLMTQLFDQIPIQFGITDPIAINEIWNSYKEMI